MKGYAMGRKDRIMGKQWANRNLEKNKNPQTTHMRDLRTIQLVRVMGLENYSYILYYFIKINKRRFLAIHSIVNKKKGYVITYG